MYRANESQTAFWRFGMEEDGALESLASQVCRRHSPPGFRELQVEGEYSVMSQYHS